MVAAEINSGSGLGGWRGAKTFAYHVLTCRWFMLFASSLIMAAGGATYMFGLYSNVVKSSLGYDQTTLNLLSFFKDLGANVGVISGLINEVTPPWVVLLIGIIMNFFGYFMIWLAVTGHIPKPKVWQMCLYICIGANSQTFVSTGALITCVKNFPGNRGSVLGLLKGYIGLSGAIITQFYHALYGENSQALILFIAYLPAAVSSVFLPTIRMLKVKTSQQHKENKVLYNFLHMSLGLAGFLMVLIIVQKQLRFSRIEYIADAIGVIFLLLLPLSLVSREEFKILKGKTLAFTNPSQIKVNMAPPQVVVPSTNTSSQKTNSCFSTIFKPPNMGEDYTILQALFSIDMLILFIATTFGSGGTLTAIDNLGQIGHSLGYTTKSITTFVSLVSIWNYLGRVVAGYVSEIVLTKYKFPRPYMLTLVLLLSCVGHVLIALGVPNSLYFASVIIGFCLGAQWPLVFAIISDIFGLKYYSTLYNFGGVASPVGSYILNVRVAGYLYDKEGLKQLKAKGLTREAGKDLICVGVECYRMAFIIITASTLLGCFVSFILALRTRKFYKGDIYRKYNEELKDAEAEMGSGKTDVVLSETQDKETLSGTEDPSTSTRGF